MSEVKIEELKDTDLDLSDIEPSSEDETISSDNEDNSVKDSSVKSDSDDELEFDEENKIDKKIDELEFDEEDQDEEEKKEKQDQDEEKEQQNKDDLNEFIKSKNKKLMNSVLYDLFKDNINNNNFEEYILENEKNKLKTKKDMQYFLNALEVLNKKSFSNNEDELLKNYNYIYPHLDDSLLNVKISQKKEFSENKYNIELDDDLNIEAKAYELCNKEFELAQHQLFVKNFISFYTPYNSLLLYHGLGTGKTCSAIGISENVRIYYKLNNINKKIIIVASPKVRENFRLQLFDESKLKLVNDKWVINNCAGNNLLKDINMLNQNVSKEKVKNLVNNVIDTYYDFIGYIELANIITKVSNIDSLLIDKESYNEKQKNMLVKNKLQKYFGERLIIIDEIHNIRDSDENSNKLVASQLYKLVSYVDNMKLLLLSATPIFNDYKEIIFLTNLLNLNDKRSIIELNDVFNKDGTFIINSDGVEIGKQLLIRKLNGYISYVKGDNPFIFPYRILPNDFDIVKSIKNLDEYPIYDINDNRIDSKIEIFDIYLNKISSYQEKAYKYIISNCDKEDLNSYKYTAFLKPLEALNIVYPNEELVKIEDDNYDDLKINIENLISKNGLNNIMSHEESNKPPSRYNYNFKKKGEENIFLKENIEKYSTKIFNILKTIENSKGPIIIYSQFIDGGLIPLALALEANGFSRFGDVKNLFCSEIFDNINKLDLISNTKINKSQKNINTKLANYTIICGDKKLTPNSEKDIKACTDLNNSNGEIIKVILISSAGSEGIDFKFIRQIHILEPWYNIHRIEQIIGRGVRTCSHKDLPFKERNVKIYMHSTLLNNKYSEAIDLFIYRKCEFKIKQIRQITRLMKELSVDCFLNSSLKSFSEENIKEILKDGINIELSNYEKINFNPGDKPNSAICDFMDNCNYQCINQELYEEENINDSTYNIDYYESHISKITNIIKDLFKEKYYYTKLELLQFLSKDSKYSANAINLALNNIIKDSNIIIKDKYSNKGYLINIDDLYIFQPLVINNKNSSLFTKTHPIRYSNSYNYYKIPEKIDDTLLNKKINLDKSKIKIVDNFEDDNSYDEDILLTARKNNNVVFNYIIEELKNILNPTSKYIESFNSNKEKIKNLSELIIHFKTKKINIFNFNDISLKTFNINSKALNYLIVNIILDTLTFDASKELISFIYNINKEFIFKESIELEIFEIIKKYYDEKIIENESKTIRGFIFSYDTFSNKFKKIVNKEDKYNYYLFVLNKSNELEFGKPMDYIDLNNIIINKYSNKKNYGNILGFIKVFDQETSNKFRNEYIFKIKTYNETKENFNSGKNCTSFSPSILMEYYEILTKEKAPKISVNLYCILIELILRYYNYTNKEEKCWFVNIDETLLDNKNYK
tara:strand:- start:6693 stop:10862 length:4170 start_codon:yes stop_codon:yes gene_type:complete